MPNTVGKLAVLMVLLWTNGAQASPIAHLSLVSEPGDWVGGGGTFSILYEDADRIFANIRRELPSGEPAELVFYFEPTASHPLALLMFGTDPLGQPIQPGFYADAVRTASPGHPGLDVSFQHRGCNTVRGSFQIDAVSFSQSPDVFPVEITAFSASFEQHCDGEEPALFGRFTYSASGILPVPVPEPSTLLLLTTCLGPISYRQWRRRQRETRSCAPVPFDSSPLKS